MFDNKVQGRDFTFFSFYLDLRLFNHIYEHFPPFGFRSNDKLNKTGCIKCVEPRFYPLSGK